MSIAVELANRIVDFHFEQLPEEAITSAKLAILDTLGVTLAGAKEKPTAILLRVLELAHLQGESLIIGGHKRTNCLDAALLNGTSAHALDFDDISDAMGGHPSAPILPALIALGERLGAGGAQLLNAYVIGFETEVKIARAVNFHHYQKGWHPTATLGVFGTAAACARLLELNQQQVANALALSVSLSAGVKANFGTMTKPLHVGNSARNGLFAALLSSQGFTASTDAFEHQQGFLNVFNGQGTFEIKKIFDGWGDPLEIVSPGIAIKQYPCCASTHPAIDASIQIIRSQKFDLDSISRIDVWIHARRLEHTNRPDPQDAMAAKFSLQYCVARALMHGNMLLQYFEGQAFRDSAARKLTEKVHVAAYDGTRFDTNNAYGAEVQITLQDGKSISKKLDAPLGQTLADPLLPKLLAEKFDNCARATLSTERVEEIKKTVADLQTLTDIRKLTKLLEVNAREGVLPPQP